ncbi:hypothetical protein [Streptomyces goshikiensis]|uniref:hypothetical protein n=1 Tax=Streptomyces goshikiensis TaxID=1942 RepID=UPI0036DDDA63
MPSGRQHLIGDLSPEDCEDHLARRLVQDGQPLIAADIRTAITARSHGLPLHLDLAASRFLEIRRTAAPPPPPTSTAPSRPSSPAPSPTSPPRSDTCCAPSRCWTLSTSTSPPRQPASPTGPPPVA